MHRVKRRGLGASVTRLIHGLCLFGPGVCAPSGWVATVHPAESLVQRAATAIGPVYGTTARCTHTWACEGSCWRVFFSVRGCLLPAAACAEQVFLNRPVCCLVAAWVGWCSGGTPCVRSACAGMPLKRRQHRGQRCLFLPPCVHDWRPPLHTPWVVSRMWLCARVCSICCCAQRPGCLGFRQGNCGCAVSCLLDLELCGMCLQPQTESQLLCFCPVVQLRARDTCKSDKGLPCERVKRLRSGVAQDFNAYIACCGFDSGFELDRGQAG